MTGRETLAEPDVDYITGGPQQDESKYHQRLGRQRREVMVAFQTKVPWALQQALRDQCIATGESVTDATTRALRRLLADDTERGIDGPPVRWRDANGPLQPGHAFLRPVNPYYRLRRERGRVIDFTTRIPAELYDQVRDRSLVTRESIIDITTRAVRMAVTGERSLPLVEAGFDWWSIAYLEDR